jgi:uncharacterized delta-60 repeat protein
MRNLLFLTIFIFSYSLSAQPGSNDNSFNPGDLGYGNGDGPNAQIFTSALQSDGKVLIGGAFTSYNGSSISRLARLNSDGSLDNSFAIGTGANNDVWAIAVQSDGKILVGGYFTTIGGNNINRIIRLNPDGTRDASFNVGTGCNGYVLSILIQSDNKIIVAGGFTTYNGTTVNYITRLNSDGTIDSGFNTGTGPSNQVNSVSLQTDGKIIIGGFFTSVNGTGRNSIARLNANGSHDTGFNPGTGANNIVLSTALQSDGKIIIGGMFTSVNGTSRNRIARLNTGGGLDNTFVVGTGAGNTVNNVAVQSDGKILMAGDFTSYNGTSINRLARLNSDGSIDNTFITGTGASAYVSALTLQPNGKIIIGGMFTSYNSLPKYRLARIETNGSLDLTFVTGTGANSMITSIALQTDGKIVAGGDFTSYNNNPVNRLVRIHSDGTTDASFNTGSGASGIINKLVLQSDGKIIIGGDFTSYDGNTRNYIARINSNGSNDNSFNIGTGAGGSVYALALQPDGKIIVGGNFTTFNGVSINRIMRLNSDGTTDNTFNVGTGANSAVTVLALQTDGKVLMGGNFTTYNGTSVNRIVRLNSNGSIDNTFNPGTGASSYLLSIALQTDGKILIGGSFLTYNGATVNHIARLNSDGTPDSGFNTGTGANNDVRAIVVQNDGKIVVAGHFTTFNNISKNRIIRLNSDGSSHSAFYPAAGANNMIRTAALQSDQKIIIAGEFTSYAGTGRNRIARVYNCSDSYHTFTASACESYTAPDGTIYTTSGTKTAVIPNASQCDSVITIDLTIKHNTTNTITISACGSYTAPDGQIHTTPGTKTAIIPNAAGCDSIITIHLTLGQHTSSTINVNACNSYTAPDGQIYTTSGIKTAIVPNASGCDSTITINLTINQHTSSSISAASCDSYTAPDGQTYTSPGIKTAIIPNAAGCDSTITINLTINHSTSHSFAVTECDTYTAPDGQIHTSSGIKTATIPNAAGCDSVITINLTLLQSTASNINASGCSSYTAPDGQIHTTSGVKTAVIPNAAGCDSVITIHLTINLPSSHSFSTTSCGTYTAPDGQEYNNSGIITAIIPNHFGCDSTITITLSVSQNSSSSVVISECDLYTAPDGIIYSVSGNYTSIIPNAAGCDSIISIDLTIVPGSFSTISAAGCGSYTAPDGQTYTSPGTYTAIIPNIAGCDSVITIHLTFPVPYQNEKICMVTVDTLLWKNKVIWEKTPGQGTSHYNIYKEVSFNVYNLAGTIAYNDPPIFTDMNSNPELYDIKYKIAAVDSCGSESYKSQYHKPIFLFLSATGSTMHLNWAEYYDESGMFMPQRYYIYRGTQPDNMTYLDTVTNLYTSYDDHNITSVYYYMIGALVEPSCNSGLSDTSYSNYAGNNMLVGMPGENGTEMLSVHPNPMSISANITITGLSGTYNDKLWLSITDITGKRIRLLHPGEWNLINNPAGRNITIERGDLKPGIYMIEVKADNVYRGKLMVE